METLKAQSVLPNIEAEHLTRSNTQIYKQTIDNPGDDDMKRRQTLWSFQHQNRGVRGKFREIGNVQPQTCNDDYEQGLEMEEYKTKSSKRINFPKIKPKIKTEVNTSSMAISDEYLPVKREYSSALRIGNSLYEQLREKQPNDSRLNSTKHRSLIKSLEKFPEVTSSLSKLGYLKAAKNVVHYGGGFFGRNGFADRRYVDFRRSWTMVTSSESKSVNNEPPQFENIEKKPHYGSLKQLSCDDTTKFKFRQHENDNKAIKQSEILKISSSDISDKNLQDKRFIESERQKRKLEKETDNQSKKSKEDMIEKEMMSEKYSINFDKLSNDDARNKTTTEVNLNEEQMRRNEEWQKDIELRVAKHEHDNGKKQHVQNDRRNKQSKRNKNIQTKSTQTEKTNRPVNHDRPESDASLDIPIDQFGPTSYRPDDVTNKLLNASYCINPYKWTSRSALTEGDRNWVEKAMEKTEIIDTTIYDVFAHKKQKSLIKNGETSAKDKTVSSNKPP